MTCREEDFYDLSLEIDQNCSLSSCLRNFRWGAGAARTTCPSTLLILLLRGDPCRRVLPQAR